MYKNHKISIVVPCHNEETQIIDKVIKVIPSFIDNIIVIDDCSKDKTIQVVEDYLVQSSDERVVLIKHEKNQGVGGAIATGYKWSRDNDIDIAVVMAGDGQMDPQDLPSLIDPIIEEGIHYTKANRLAHGEAYNLIPKVRYFGNAILSLLTKIASGYWHVVDSQAGYAAINKEALHVIDWDKMYKRYGQPNDILVRLNVESFKVRDVIVKPVYNVGEKSGIKVRKVVFSISKLLFKLFFWRLKEKYIIRDFHPLVFFYTFGFFMLFTGAFLFLSVLVKWHYEGMVPAISTMLWLFTTAMGFQSLFFAMWFDMEVNKELR